MELIRFKCVNLDCQKDFYCYNEDVENVPKGYPDGWPMCPFCEEFKGVLKIGTVQFDDKSTMDTDMIIDVVTLFRKDMQSLEMILYKLENLTPVMGEENG